MVPWVVGACVTPADGSPNIDGGAEFVLQNSVCIIVGAPK